MESLMRDQAIVAQVQRLEEATENPLAGNVWPQSHTDILEAELRMDLREVWPISQASAKQRAGRAGRTRDGICYRLHSKESHDPFKPSTGPAIKMVNYDWIDAPHSHLLPRIFEIGMGVLKENASLTLSGRIAMKCPSNSRGPCLVTSY
ncbi:hypothetical protein EsHS_00004070 [Epichloe bromicola]